jgi:hypothetical protein
MIDPGALSSPHRHEHALQLYSRPCDRWHVMSSRNCAQRRRLGERGAPRTATPVEGSRLEIGSRLRAGCRRKERPRMGPFEAHALVGQNVVGTRPIAQFLN